MGDQTTEEPKSEIDQHGGSGGSDGVADGGRADSSEVTSQAAGGRPREPKTGKEIVPGWDGSTPIRDYRRRIELFLATTGIDPEYRAGRLVEQLKDAAWRATETLDMSLLRTPDGVSHLLAHLQEELEPVEYLQVFSTLSTFYKGFRRQKGEEMVTYDTRYRVQCQKLDEVGAGISGLTKAYWFLECAAISEEVRKQVIAAAGGDYSYEKLRTALIAIIPRVQRDERDGPSSSQANKGHTNQPRQFRNKNYGHKTHKVNMVDEHGEEPDPGEEEEEFQHEPNEEEIPLEELEEKAQVLVTQAAKRRAEIEKQRGYTKPATNESDADRQKRITNMKATMACSACRSHGEVRYGHWHNDPQCPYFQEKKGGKAVFCVDQGEDSEDSEDAFGVFMSDWDNHYPMDKEKVIRVRKGNLALCDTCCARSVAGEKWLMKYMQRLTAFGQDYYVIDEDQSFRFGAGPKKRSCMAAIVPTAVQANGQRMYLRISMVSEDVPLLLSRKALQSMGAILDLPGGCMRLKSLDLDVPLRNTASGHVGLEIWNDEVMSRPFHVNWMDLVDDDAEVKFLGVSRTEGEKHGLARTPHRPISSSKSMFVDETDDAQAFMTDLNEVCSSPRDLENGELNSELCDDRDGSSPCSKAQGRVHSSHCVTDSLVSGRAECTLSGPTQGNLEAGETQLLSGRALMKL